MQEKSAPDADWRTVLEQGEDDDVLELRGLTPASSLAFRVQAFNSSGASESVPIAVTTPAADPAAGPAARFEAENPLEVLRSVGKSGPVAATSAAQVSGKCVTLFDPGDAIRIAFSAPSGGAYRIGVRVRSGAANLPIGTEYWPYGYVFRLDGKPLVLSGDLSTVPRIKEFRPDLLGHDVQRAAHAFPGAARAGDRLGGALGRGRLPGAGPARLATGCPAGRFSVTKKLRQQGAVCPFCGAPRLFFAPAAPPNCPNNFFPIPVPPAREIYRPVTAAGRILPFNCCCQRRQFSYAQRRFWRGD